MIRAVVFDAFGTLFRPRSPIHVQYAQVAESYGLVVTPSEVKDGFRKAYKEVAKEHPLYGKISVPPLDYNQWWELIVEKTFDYAGVASSDLQTTLPTLFPALMNRFSSSEGYVLHDDTIPALEYLQRQGIKLGIISNSDPRTIEVVDSLGVVPKYIPHDNITLSWHVGYSKPSAEIFQAASRTMGVPPSQTLMIGDDLDEDYRSAKAAGLQALLVKRDRHEADWVRKETNGDDLKDVEVVTSLKDIGKWVETFNRTTQ